MRRSIQRSVYETVNSQSDCAVEYCAVYFWAFDSHDLYRRFGMNTKFYVFVGGLFDKEPCENRIFEIGHFFTFRDTVFFA